MVDNGERPVAELRRRANQLVGMGCTIEKTEVRVTVQLGVGDIAA